MHRRTAVLLAFAAHPLAPLIGRSMGDMTSSDLVAVAGSLGRQDQFPVERPALELLRACLEYRFGADMAIGEADGVDFFGFYLVRGSSYFRS